MKYYFIALTAFLFASSVFAQDAVQTMDNNSNNSEASKTNTNNNEVELKSSVKDIANAINNKSDDKNQNQSISESDLEVIDRNEVKLSNTLEEFEMKKKVEIDNAHTGLKISGFFGDDSKYGGDVSYRFKIADEIVGLRFSYAHMSGSPYVYNEDGEELGNGEFGHFNFAMGNFDYKQKGNEFALLFDYVPFRFGTWGNMYFTVGLHFGKQDIEVRNVRLGAVVDYLIFNDNVYSISGDYFFMSDIERNLTGPYLGFGFDFNISKYFGIFFDLGLLFPYDTKYSHVAFVNGQLNGYRTDSDLEALVVLDRLIHDYSKDVQDSIFGKVVPKGRLGLFIKF